MNRRWLAMAVLTTAVLLPTVAEAQFGAAGGGGGYHGGRRGRGGNGPAMTASGPVYNPTQSPEYQLYARNPAAYQQLMMQRYQQAAQKQMQQLQKQQQQFEKWLKDQKAKKDKGQPTDPAYDQLMKMQEAQAKATLYQSNRTLRGTVKARGKKAKTRHDADEPRAEETKPTGEAKPAK